MSARVALGADARGVVTVEYALLLSLVAVTATLALIGLGAFLLRLFQYQQALLLLPLC